MESNQSERNELVYVEYISPNGIGLYVLGKQYFLDFEYYPFFKEQAIRSINNVQIIHENHLYWPDLDVDLEIDNLENSEKYPLSDKTMTPEASSRRLARLGGTEKQLRPIPRRRII